MRDIQNREDLLFLMEAFYSRMMKDEQIGYIFTDVAKLDLNHHLPLLADFWNNALFHAGGYKNNVAQIHKDLSHKEKLTPSHFDRWQELLATTINEHFKGENCRKNETSSKSSRNDHPGKIGSL